jgi:general secretion pathway protein F
MPVYEYQAIARTGKKVKGVIDADSPAAARRKLRDQRMLPTAVKDSFVKTQAQAEVRGGFGRVSQRDVAVMTRQLAVLLQAGMDLVEALTALLQQTSNSRLQKIVYDLRDRVNEGARLTDALGEHRRVFSELYVNMVAAGETSGALEQVLFRLAEILEKQVRLTRKIQATLAYPAFMALVGIGVISFLMVVIVPKITDLFVRQDRELPMITQVLITVCEVLADWWPVLVLSIIGLFLLWRWWVKRPEGRKRWDRLKLHIPLYSGLYVRLLSSRFCRTLGTMLSSGLTMMNGLEVVKSVLQNRVIEDAMEDVKANVRRGKDLSVPLKELNVFPPMMLSMVELGQRSGELDSMLLRVADTYDDEVETSVEALVSLLEPAMIVVMALFVGFLVIAILLPIMEMSSGY